MSGKARSADATLHARETLLATLAETGNVTASCQAAGIDRRTAYRWRDEDEEYHRRWDEALDVATDALRAEVRRRGVEGVERGVYYRGERIDTVREYSDRMLELEIKRHDPAYRDVVRQEVTGKDGGAIETRSQVSAVGTAELEARLAALEAALGGQS